MAILKELWTGEEDTEVKTTYQYVIELEERLEQTMKLAKESLIKARGKNKAYFDKRSKEKKFKVGEKVLLLLPMAKNKLELKWRGPYEIVEVKEHNNYKLELEQQRKT